MAHIYLYMQVHGQKKALRDGHVCSIFSQLSHECRAFFPKKRLCTSLGLSPSRTNLVQEITTLGGDLYRKAPTIFPIGNLFDPTIGQHDLQIPGQRGWVEAQPLPNLDTPNGANLCYKNQKISLACFQAKWTKFSIVDAREHTIKFAHAHQQALARYTINEINALIHSFLCFSRLHVIILHIQLYLVKSPGRKQREVLFKIDLFGKRSGMRCSYSFNRNFSDRPRQSRMADL